MSEWQPIDSAPKDGTNILLSNGVVVAEGCWVKYPSDYEQQYEGFEGWSDYLGDMIPPPIHWQPLPEPPK